MCEKKLLNLSNVLIHRMLHLHSRQVYLKEFQVKRFVSCILPCPPNTCSVDFCYRFENDAKVRKDKLEKQRRAKEKQIDEMAKGSKRKNNYNPKTLQILKRKGLLNQSSGEVVERLHKWKQTTKNKNHEGTVVSGTQNTTVSGGAGNRPALTIHELLCANDF